MTNYKKQIVSMLAAGAMVLNLAVPAFASTTIQISGNGAGSDNAVVTTQTSTNTVSQNNTANVTNNVTTNANTGNNTANFNTGGNTTVTTGGANTTANVTNTLNSNAAQISNCNCGSNTDVKISDNGALSQNQVNPLTVTNTNTISQNNEANVTNNVNAKASTGGNDATFNTGGNTTIRTGTANSTANVKTVANANMATIGGSATSNPTASFTISGNGAGSNNYISAVLENTNSVSQNNDANVTNNVTTKAKTGYNDANFNTGGNDTITTGAANATANVDNMVNFNSASVDCGCLFNVLAKISGNGAGTLDHGLLDFLGLGGDNSILLDLENTNVVAQNNEANLTNDVYAKAKTGGNVASENTGPLSVDPTTIMTGAASELTNVHNAGNVNMAGKPFSISLPGGSSLGLSFNLQALLAFFGISMH